MDHLEWTVRELDELRKLESRIKRETRIVNAATAALGILGALLIAAIVLRLEG